MRYPSTKASQKPADPRQAFRQAGVQRLSTPVKSSTLFIDGVYVQMQTSARGRGRKVVPGSSSTPSRFASTRGRWLQGRYKSVPEDSQSLPGNNLNGKFQSKLFSSAILMPRSRGVAQNLPPFWKRPSGTPDVRYAPTQVHQIPEHLGGYDIKRLKPRWPVVSQKRVFPRMRQAALPGSSLRKDSGRWM